MEKLILVLGTGRCASNSFCKLLSLQNNVNATWHMGNNPIVNWYYNDEDFVLIKKLFDQRSEQIVVDVSHFLLNYAEKLMEEYQDRCEVKFLFLFREHHEMIASFRTFVSNIIEVENLRNLWKTKNRTELLSLSNSDYVWNLYNSFPNFDHADDIAECLHYYWDFYERRMNRFLNKYASNPSAINVRHLNDVTKVKKEILREFLGFEFPMYKNFREKNPNLL